VRRSRGEVVIGGVVFHWRIKGEHENKDERQREQPAHEKKGRRLHDMFCFGQRKMRYA